MEISPTTINLLLFILRGLNQVLTAAVAITAFSLLIYALTFNLRNRVARSFAIIMICMVIVFTGEALGSTAVGETAGIWLRIRWVGIVFIPAVYLHISDALLETTGRPSRGRRRWLGRLAYVLSGLFLLTLLTPYLVGNLVLDGKPTPFLERQQLFWVFTLFYLFGLVVAGINFIRAYRRTRMKTSRRRFAYLLVGSLAPALGAYPYLLLDSNLAADHQIFFWWSAGASNMLVLVLMVIMAYSVAFFGVSWPDRVVKQRLFKWLLRGTVTASSLLAITTLVRRIGENFGTPYSAMVPLAMVITVLLLGHGVTLAAPIWERWLFHGGGIADLRLLQQLEDRLITPTDLRQFIEAVLAAACDLLQVPQAFVAVLDDNQVGMMISVGGGDLPETDEISGRILEQVNGINPEELLSWGDYWLIPLKGTGSEDIIGLFGISHNPSQSLESDQLEALVALGQKTAMTLEDRRLQQQLLDSLRELEPQVQQIQRLRAAVRYDQSGLLDDLESDPPQEFPQWVKDALTHYWGGPKLSGSPLMELQVVQRALEEHGVNPVNAMRAILKRAVGMVRPEGDRKFTPEWVLFNILEMKFLEGRKVRDVAFRLSVSEADLYRKQRVAIEAVAQAIVQMEREARDVTV